MLEASPEALAAALEQHKRALAYRRRTLTQQLTTINNLINDTKKYLGEDMPASTGLTPVPKTTCCSLLRPRLPKLAWMWITLSGDKGIYTGQMTGTSAS